MFFYCGMLPVKLVWTEAGPVSLRISKLQFQSSGFALDPLHSREKPLLSVSWSVQVLVFNLKQQTNRDSVFFLNDSILPTYQFYVPNQVIVTLGRMAKQVHRTVLSTCTWKRKHCSMHTCNRGLLRSGTHLFVLDLWFFVHKIAFIVVTFLTYYKSP